MSALQDTAREARKAFRLETRADGSSYWARGNDEPVLAGDDWTNDLVYDAHRYGPGTSDVLLPDDYRYAVIVEALELFAGDQDEDAEWSFAFDHDVYTADLLKWISSNSVRLGYVQDAVDEGLIGPDTSEAERLMMGQVVERREVFVSVLASLDARVAEVAA